MRGAEPGNTHTAVAALPLGPTDLHVSPPMKKRALVDARPRTTGEPMDRAGTALEVGWKVTAEVGAGGNCVTVQRDHERHAFPAFRHQTKRKPKADRNAAAEEPSAHRSAESGSSVWQNASAVDATIGGPPCQGRRGRLNRSIDFIVSRSWTSRFRNRDTVSCQGAHLGLAASHKGFEQLPVFEHRSSPHGR